MDSPGKQPLTDKRFIVDKDLIKILEELRDWIDTLSYGSMGNIMTYKDLTKLLAKKIEASGGVRKLRGIIKED